MKEAFLKRMQSYLQEEYPAYLETLSKPRYRGLRVNTVRCGADAFLPLAPCACRPSLICRESFYIDAPSLGHHPLHLSGVFYLQEPSAASAVEILDVQEGDWVLDICAAPGGKSTQIAAKLHHTGFLVSNEIDAKRAQALLSNMERLGFSEYMVTNSRPDVLCEELQGCFDKVLVDAPCSGEGMFKKHEQAMEDWSEEQVAFCAKRQRMILAQAYRALRPGGTLVYSTCTYAMEENEETVQAFLQQFPDMELVDCEASFGRPGLPLEGFAADKVRRIFPMDGGEGHFIAKLRKQGQKPRRSLPEYPAAAADAMITAFFQEQLGQQPARIWRQQDHIYARLQPFVKTKKIRVLRQGVLCGDMVKKRFEPHLHFYLAAIYASSFFKVYDMSLKECEQYLKGYPLAADIKGYVCLRYQGFALGFGKGDGTWIKNKYPKGLRWKEQMTIC